MLTIKQSGDFKHMETFLKRVSNSDHFKILDHYGQEGVNALADMTPKDSGETSNSWMYDIKIRKNYVKITWSNSKLTDKGIPVAILLQYGHGTNGGGFVYGRDYINPAIRPVFDRIAQEIWKEVIRK